ncbi:AP-4 complex subunit epsilon-1 [Latimeria chalumnae]|uniref:AP-4 complex subunit epsilon n=1 Tax=Latimeria chalumnae TaxID=7897 RepID=H3AE96_LATCH|nr:PREDICTED: AP-4 complex subunit epsilon-1 [Latimeria chalumnae]|eukprot:XP_006001978.1 PREDICTED: AP-4 complex subunit epsilon-1 [Latimeria chalumnae]
MSDVVERTLTALPSLLSLDSQAGTSKLSAASKLGSLIRTITALTSKHEEENVIKKELAALKEHVSSPNTTLKQMKECMVRLIYCEMLGYEAPFGYIHAIKLAQQGSVLEKRVGYLAVSLFLNEANELLLLLVNTVLKDLQSTNIIEVCMALTVASQIFPREMIPAVLPLIEDKLQHSKEIVRRKAVLALYKFYLIAPNQVQHIHDKFRKALCDRDAGVMAASLHIYLQMIKENPDGFKDLTVSFVTILKQVVGGKLPVDFNYHSVPAPWLQIQLLRILGLLGKDDQRTSELMYDVLDESIRRAEINHNITYAILFECVQTVYTIYPKVDLLEKAAKCIGKFVLSPKINLKYLGLKALAYVVQQDPNLALQHQMTIIECLDHHDPIIKRGTLELLYRITNGQNVIVIAQKMLDYLKQSKEEYTTISLVGKVAELAEKYAPDNKWFIQTMNVVFSLGGDVMHPDIPNNFLRLLAEGFDDETENRQLRLYAVQSSLALLQKQNMHYPQRFLQVMSWVLGEYSYLKRDLEPDTIIQTLCTFLENDSVTCETKAWVVAAITKLSAVTGCSKTVNEIIEKYSTSLDTCLRQYAFELKQLQEDRQLMNRVLPVDSSCEDIMVDASLSFLDGFVAEALSHGAAPYKPHHQRQEEKLSQEKALNFEPYGLSFPAGRQSPSRLSLSSGLSANSTEIGLKESDGLKLEGVKKVWGKEGYLPIKETKEESIVQALPSVPDCTALENALDHSISKTELLSSVLSDEQKEKHQLASSLFVGLGSDCSVNLMGKTDNTVQKFRRKSKPSEVLNKNEKTVNFQNSTTSPSSKLPNFLDDLAIRKPFQEKKLLSLRKNVSLDCLESFTSIDKSQPESKMRLQESSDSREKLFADSNLEVIHSAHHVRTPVANKMSSELVPSLPDELSKEAHSDTMVLCTDEILTVSSCNVWKEDCLVVVLFITNNSTLEIEAVNIELVHAEEFTVSESLGCCLSTIAAQHTASYQYCVQVEKPCIQGMVFGHVTYHLQSEQSSQLEFSLTLLLSDFIRPLRISTEEFGKLWLSLSNDVKQNLRLLSDTQDALTKSLNILKQKLRLHIVDIIGKEGIVAGQLLPSTPCLLHCRVHVGTLAVWLRSPSSALPDCLLYQCQKALEES